MAIKPGIPDRLSAVDDAGGAQDLIAHTSYSREEKFVGIPRAEVKKKKRPGTSGVDTGI